MTGASTGHRTAAEEPAVRSGPPKLRWGTAWVRWCTGGLSVWSTGRSTGPLFDLPSRVLLEPVVPAAFGAAITQAAPATGLVWDVVLEVAIGGGSSATRGRASGVPDLGEVAEQDAGVVAGGLESVITLFGGDRVQSDDQVRLPRGTGGQPPGAVATGRTVLVGGGEGEPRVIRVADRAGRVVATRRAWTAASWAA